MKDKAGFCQFEHTKQYLFQLCHPAEPGVDLSLEKFTCECTYPKAVNASIALIAEFNLPWVKISYGDWSRVIDTHALWLTNSGKFISGRYSVFRKGMSPLQLLVDEPLLRKTSFGWGLYNCDYALDGMAHRYIGWHLNPMISKYFEKCVSFEFHLFSRAPEIPGWLSAEYFPAEKALAVYGNELSNTDEVDIDDDFAREVSIAIQIQSAFGVREANEWVKLHREFQNKGAV